MPAPKDEPTTIITGSMLRRMAGERSFNRGEKCFTEGAVGKRRINDGVITVKVWVSRDYRVPSTGFYQKPVQTINRKYLIHADNS